MGTKATVPAKRPLRGQTRSRLAETGARRLLVTKKACAAQRPRAKLPPARDRLIPDTPDFSVPASRVRP
jgi:hypothetical protein